MNIPRLVLKFLFHLQKSEIAFEALIEFKF